MSSERRRCVWLLPLVLLACGRADSALSKLKADQAFARRAAWTPELRAQLAARRKALRWTRRPWKPKLTPGILDRYIEMAGRFLRSNQRPKGNFNYRYDFVRRRMSKGDNQVRQAGALWGLSTLHAFRPGPETRRAVERGLDFFARHSRPIRDKALTIHYPKRGATQTGTVALVALAIIDYLRSERDLPQARRTELTRLIEGFLNFLKLQQFPDGTFADAYWIAAAKPSFTRSCYFDGEALLAFCKAAKYLGYRDLLPRIQVASATMVQRYVLAPLSRELDPKETKQFCQWGTMSFWECSDAKWPNGEACGDAALVMAWWTIHSHNILNKTRNTGYAYEGLVHAWLIASARSDIPAMTELRQVIDDGLARLISWQVNGPLAEQNSFLRLHPTKDPLAIGGAMIAGDRPSLRIDVTQHQSHATILARRHMYSKRAPK